MVMKQADMEGPLGEWGQSAPYWEKHAETIRALFAPMTRALIAEAGIGPGMKVLDVAAGSGEPSLTMAGAVGPAGSVTCTDVADEMVEAARREAGRRGLTNVVFRQCDAVRLPFRGGFFDATVSRLGAMFFPDPLRALREMLRVTRPGGSVALAVWARSDLNPFFHIITGVMSRRVQMPPADAGAPGAFRFAAPGELARLLAEAGASGVGERRLEFRMEAPISPDEFWALRSEMSSTLRETITTLPAEERGEVAREVIEAGRGFFPGGRMSMPAEAIIVTGRKEG